MSTLTLYHRFRVLIHMSLLQYRKQLSAQAARGRRLDHYLDGSTVAFEVGCDNVFQFILEYIRLFGQPLTRSIKTLTEGRLSN